MVFKNKSPLKSVIKSLCLMYISIHTLTAQTTSWTLWATGLPAGVFPKLTIAPNHDIFYGLTGTGSAKGIIHKANTTTATGIFTAMPQINFPASVTNNVQTLMTNVNNEPIVGIFRSNASDPFLFRYDNTTNAWLTVSVNALPNLGAFCTAISPNGTLWIGTKWGYIYRSTNNGATFTRIDETPIVQQAYPCYYPTWSGNPSDGAIYSINVDKNGRVYAGTEGAGVIYSDDNGVSWHPADFRACQVADATKKDAASPMQPLSNTGNLGAIGFTTNNKLIFNGTNMWTFNWNSTLGLADMTAHTVTQATGIQQYFIAQGLQVTKIVTTTNGHIFLHSGSNASVPTGTIGIYTSTDGINWTLFNTGITSGNTGQAQGSLATDGNKVFMATTDGKIWLYDTNPAIVPITLTYFKGKAEKAANLLTWETASEINSQAFTLEKSLDGQSFNAIGTVKASGNSTKPLVYTFEDKAVAEEKSYYRLNTMDRDGKSEYSSVILVDRATQPFHAWTLAPNPANDHIQLSFFASKRTFLSYRIINTLGQTVLTAKKDCETGDNSVDIDIQSLAKGVYYLNIENDGAGNEGMVFYKK